jgi:dipeptidyl aminopeptidase/acylaminoacyl peptidase
MKRIALLSAFFPLLLATAAFAADSSPPAEVFGRMPAETDPALSPDGHWAAWFDRTESKPRVVMFDVEARKVQRTLAVPENVKLQGLVWNDNETLLTRVSQTARSTTNEGVSREIYRTIAEDVSGGDGRMLPSFPHRAGRNASVVAPLASLVAARLPTPHTVIMATYDSCRCLWQIDTRTGDGSVLAYGTEFTTGWVVDREGRPVAREDWDWHHHSYRVMVLGERADEKLHEILRRDDSERPILAGLTPDGAAVVMLATSGLKHQAAWAVPLDGSAPQVIAEDPEADITSVYYDGYSGAIIGVYVSGNVTKIKWLDATAQHRQDVLEKAFRGKQVFLYGWTADGSKSLAEVLTPSSPPVYYLVNFTTHRADIVAEENPALANVTLGEVKEISYRSRDGTEIPAYLTLPASKPSGPVPLVVVPHGGPQGRNHLGFDWLNQFLASRGYAVLQPQFRGSSGFGQAFLEAGYRQWGGLMQDDVSDGVRAMIDQGIADPHRVCIVGTSTYGSYSALAGAAFTPDLYACAVSISGISDLQAFMREANPQAGRVITTDTSSLREHIGSPHDPNLASKSPINAVKAVKAPILIMYGSGDTSVPVDQSIKMASALQGAGKSVKMVVLPGEGYWTSLAQTRIQVLKELEGFLGEHL